jgi:hypothetical protein
VPGLICSAQVRLNPGLRTCGCTAAATPAEQCRSPPAAPAVEDLVLPGPGGSNSIPRGARAPLSTTNLRRVYKAAGTAAPAAAPWAASTGKRPRAMMARVTAALDERIGRALAVAAYLLRERRDSRAVDGGEGR